MKHNGRCRARQNVSKNSKLLDYPIEARPQGAVNLAQPPLQAFRRNLLVLCLGVFVFSLNLRTRPATGG